MSSKQLLEYFLAHPIPAPIRRLGEYRMTTRPPDQRLFADDLFLIVIACIYNGWRTPPSNYRLFAKEVKRSGLVTYHPEVKSWADLLKKTAALLRQEGSLAWKRKAFENYLPKHLGHLSGPEIARFLREVQATILKPDASVTTSFRKIIQSVKGNQNVRH